MTALGFMWNIPSSIMGLTLLAWANSVGDLVADISLAKVGKAKTAVAACFGAPLLNLLVGLGLGCLIAILTVPGREDGVSLFVSPTDGPWGSDNVYFRWTNKICHWLVVML